MPPKKKLQPLIDEAIKELTNNGQEKMSGVFGWCLVPQHDLCPGETTNVRCSCKCHTEKKVEKNEPAAPGTDS